jgi:L-asparaginase
MSPKRVVVLHTGGTLGMHGGPLEPGPWSLELLRRVPELSELATIETRILCNLDSSDIGLDEWIELAREIARAREQHDGVVVIHGTDTMAYTASALSFALEGLDRPVVLTGSQRPLAEVRTDARRNLVDAVDLATRDIPEVGICFDGQLLRGNRASKGDAWSYGAFASPNCAPLARLGLDVELGAHIRRPSSAFRLDTRFDSRVAVAWITPGMDAAALHRLAGDGALRGLVLAAFGVGNVPIAVGIGEEVRRLVDGGVDVVVVTQARAGGVELGRYKNGLVLAEAGAISGHDMGLEAAVVKLMAALGRWPDDAGARRVFLTSNVAGERA